jgi:hypothetical protein
MDFVESLGLNFMDQNSGDLNSVPDSAYDPLFFYHHTYVDYMYAEWQTMIQAFVIQIAEQKGKTLTTDQVMQAERAFYPGYFF